MARSNRFKFRASCALMIWVLALPAIAQAQQPASDTAQVILELKQQVTELQAAIKELRAEATQYRAETQQLRTELQKVAAEVRPAGEPPAAAAAPGAAAPSAAAEAHLAKLQDQYDLLSGKVDEQYQTKVESASKYRVRLSGLVLLNLSAGNGAVDNLDMPAIALPHIPGEYGSGFAATLRQSQIGLEVFGPQWRGARVRGNIQMDFAGGFPTTENGVTMGIMRLRTGVVRMDWPRTSIIAGQDAPFFSALSPTSIAQLALPALSYSGNLWTWTPQLRIEHRIAAGQKSSFTVQAGILDPLTGEVPPSQFERVPQAGEASRQPAYAAHLAWTSSNAERPATLGGGVYFSRQNWDYGREVNAWAATADWSVPLGRIFSVSGEFYRGRAIGGLGGAIGGTVLFSGLPGNPASSVVGLDALGGWAQLKARASSTLEFNVAAGQDNPFASQLRGAAVVGNLYYPGAARNRSVFTNFIYRPRSDLLFSMEYRRIESFNLNVPMRSADQVNLMMGVLF